MAPAQGGRVLSLKRIRIVFLASSLVVVVLAASLVVAGRSRKDDLYRALGNLAQVVHLIHTQYVDPVNLGALGEGLDAGLVESVDTRAAVLDDAEVERYKRLVEEPPAFGIVLGLRLGTAAARQVLPGSPAAGAGLKEWEILEKVDGLPTRGMPLWRVRLLFARHVATKKPLELTVFGQNVEKRRQVKVAVARWRPEVVKSQERDGVRVLKIESLPRGAAEAIRNAAGTGPLILDLRHLVWGREDEVFKMADLFAASGTLGVWRGRRAGEKSFAAHAGALPLAAKPVVLVGDDTEGVGEILAAALNRAGCTVIGMPTEGAAEHLSFVHENGLNLLLPVGRWLRSDGKPIDDNGVLLDEEVKVTGEEAAGADPILERGLQLARGAHAKAA